MSKSGAAHAGNHNHKGKEERSMPSDENFATIFAICACMLIAALVFGLLGALSLSVLLFVLGILFTLFASAAFIIKFLVGD